MSSKEKQIDDIVAMLDQFMSESGGHMNIQVSPDGAVTAEKTVETANSLECSKGDMACKVPTLFEGLDNEKEQQPFGQRDK